MPTTPENGRPPADADLAAVVKAQPLAAVRGIGVPLGPALLLDLCVAGSVVAAATGRLARPAATPAGRILRPLLALGAVAPAAYVLAIRPWLQRWGATAAEQRKPLPGDELVPEPAAETTRAITIHAPVDAVWPWLAQIGQDRGGFYSYAWLENLAGCRLRNADRIHPEWQHRAVGDRVPLHPLLSGPKVTAFEPNHALVLDGWGAFVVEPLDAQTTRLIIRGRTPRGWAALAYGLLWEIPHFIMERQMLLGLKERAERAWAAHAAVPRTPGDSSSAVAV
jgi:hypothetical protein